MKPKFIEKFQLSAPEITEMGEFEIGMKINTLIQPVESLDDAISKEIIKMCEEKGINDLWLLDKKAIVSALEKQIPKKPLWGATSNASWRSCPECHSREYKTFKFCSQCGQALDWGDSE